jgi:hypothetical protein
MAVLLVAASAALARAGRRDWVGSATCASCHPAAAAAWRSTAHAATAARVSERSPGRCRVCHATGEAPAGPTVELGVGCEACHGAGGHYAEDDLMRDRELAAGLGLADVTTASARAATCARCHRPGLRRSAADLLAAAHPPLPSAIATPAGAP